MKVNTVIFDFDDTLLATFKSRCPALLEAAADFGQTISEGEIREVWGLPFRKMVHCLVPMIDFQEFYDHYRNVMKKHLPLLHEGAAEILKTLKAQGKFIVISTSSSRDLVLQDLIATGVNAFIDQVFGYEDSEYHKPDPRVLEPVIQLLRTRGKEHGACVFVGDSVRDYLVAIGNHIPFYAVTTGHEDKEDLMRAGLRAEQVFSDLYELFSATSELSHGP